MVAIFRSALCLRSMQASCQTTHSNSDIHISAIVFPLAQLQEQPAVLGSIADYEYYIVMSGTRRTISIFLFF